MVFFNGYDEMSKDQLWMILYSSIPNMINIELKEGMLKQLLYMICMVDYLIIEANSNMLTLTMNHLNAGICLVRVQTQNGFTIKKIIKK